MSGKRKLRTGNSVIMLLVVLLLVGLLTHQTVRSLWILRRSQDHQLKIQQANQLIELGRSLDQQSQLTSGNAGQMSSWVVQVGSQYGKLEIVEQSAESGSRSLWIAKLPVDANGVEFPNQVAVTVSCERSR